MPRWDFERRRPCWSYFHMNQTARVANEFISRNGEAYGPDNYESFRRDLMAATDYDWGPTSPGYSDVFRNYGRLFEGFGIVTVIDDNMTLLPVGRWLVEEEPTEEEYYQRTVSTFRYPNVAFASFEQWRRSGRVLSPFLALLQCLRHLGQHQNEAYLTPREVLSSLYEAHDGLPPSVLVEAVMSFRHGTEPPRELPRTPLDVTTDITDARQVREVLAFLETAGFLTYDARSLQANTRVHLADARFDLGAFEPVPLFREVAENRPVPVHREFVEGELYHEERLIRRRNPLIRNEALTHYGRVCEVCGATYDILGESRDRVFDVHHLIPVGDAQGTRTVGVEDVRVLCSNCHRIAHSRRPPLSVAEARHLLGLE